MTSHDENNPLKPTPSDGPSAENGAYPHKRQTSRRNKKLIAAAIVGGLVLLILLIFVIVFLTQKNDSPTASTPNEETTAATLAAAEIANTKSGETGETQNAQLTAPTMATTKPTEKVRKKLIPPNPENHLPPSNSKLKIFSEGAVCSDSEECSLIGKDIFLQGGNAIDATIATMFCTGITTMQSMGIGGGFILNFYKKDEKKSYTLDAREQAAQAATKDMFGGDLSKSIHSPLAIAIPGEVAGYYEAWQRFGSMLWEDLVQPSISLCDDGFFMSRHMQDAISFIPNLKDDEYLGKLFYNKTSKQYYRERSLIRPEKLCDTLRIIAENGGYDFYNGTVAEMLVKDLKDIGSIITKDDLESYKASWTESETIEINTDTVHLVPFPGGGLIIGFILNVLKGYNITADDVDDLDGEILFNHRLVEAFKYAFSRRTMLGDPAFVDIGQVVADMQNETIAELIRQSINDHKTSNDPNDYDAIFGSRTNHGTSPLTLIAPNGDAVAVTSSVNFYFGSMLSGPRSGVIFNNGMNDFSIPGVVENLYGFRESPANCIEGRKRPLSSMSPTIVTDENGDVKLVLSAAGGSKITTAISSAIIRSLLMGYDIKAMVDEPRIHHQLFPMEIQYEYGNTEQLIEGLEKLGHNATRYKDRGSVLCALAKNSTAIYGNADYRKRGDVDGY